MGCLLRVLMRPCGLAWVVVWMVVCVVGSSGSTDRPSHLSSDPQVNTARALIEGGRFDEALVILRPIAPGHADRIDALFLVGLAALGAAEAADDERRDGLLDEAIGAFHAILVERPELVRVRLELARAFFLKGEDDLSRRHFERVLAGNPHPAVAANIMRFLGAIRERRRWRGYVGVSLAPDTNVNAASDARTINIFGLPFERDSESGAKSGVGIVLRGGGEYQYPLASDLRLRMGVDISFRQYSGKEFDQTMLSTHMGPRWLIDEASEVSLLASARRHWTAGRHQFSEIGARLETEHRFSRRVVGQGNLSWHRRRYEREKERDGHHAALSFGLRWQATATVQADASMGYSKERTQVHHLNNSRRFAGLGISVALPRGFTVGAGGELIGTDYEGGRAPFVVDGGAREDRTRILRGSVYHRAFNLSGFSPRLVLINEKRKSNAQLHDYKRNRAELQFERQF